MITITIQEESAYMALPDMIQSQDKKPYTTGFSIPEYESMSYWSWKYNPAAIESNLHIVKQHLKEMKNQGVEFDGVVVCGTSGSWLASLLVTEGIDVILVRKPGENTHGREIEGPPGKKFKNLVFIDDLIASGNTLGYVADKMKAEGATVVAYSLYADCPRWLRYTGREHF